MQAKTTPSDTSVNGHGDATGVVATVSREIHNVLADAEDLLKATTSLTGEDLARVRARLAKGVAAARESMNEMTDAVADRARKTAKTTDAYVHEQPWIVIGACTATAFVLGLLVARRS